jgi:hypothetical protein
MKIDGRKPGSKINAERRGGAFSAIRGTWRGVSIIELIVTLAIVVIVLTAALGILNQTSARMQYLGDMLSRQHQAQTCLDRLVEDILAADVGKMEIKVEREKAGWLRTAHLQITSKAVENPDGQGQESGIARIDWVAVPRVEENDLVLFRREQPYPVEKPAFYIPLCENLNSFEVNLMDGSGKTIEDASRVELLSVRMEYLPAGASQPDRLITLERTVCVNRFGKPIETAAEPNTPADNTNATTPENQAQSTPVEKNITPQIPNAQKTPEKK